MTNFNPLRREGGDLKGSVQKEPFLIFQSTPPRGRRHVMWDDLLVDEIISIHSAARAETAAYYKHPSSWTISIHSAARAETVVKCIFSPAILISIHSAARAETHTVQYYVFDMCYFNPLRREGGDRQEGGEKDWRSHFNPLRREGGDSMNASSSRW